MALFADRDFHDSIEETAREEWAAVKMLLFLALCALAIVCSGALLAIRFFVR